MKVQSESPTKITKKEPKKMSQDDIKAKIKAKFGKDLNEKKAPPVEDKAEISKKAGVKNSSEKDFGDIASNDPNSEVTKSKLKDLLKSGAFQFNDGERKALSQILK